MSTTRAGATANSEAVSSPVRAFRVVAPAGAESRTVGKAGKPRCRPIPLFWIPIGMQKRREPPTWMMVVFRKGLSGGPNRGRGASVSPRTDSRARAVKAVSDTSSLSRAEVGQPRWTSATNADATGSLQAASSTPAATSAAPKAVCAIWRSSCPPGQGMKI
jgi:hypothetical protein